MSEMTSHWLINHLPVTLCGICNKYFTQSYNLVARKRIHSNDKP